MNVILMKKYASTVYLQTVSVLPFYLFVKIIFMLPSNIFICIKLTHKFV